MAGVRFLVRYGEETVAGTFMVLMFLTTFMNVIARYFFNSPIQWAEEFSRYAFIWVVFIGAALCSKYRRHIIIDGFVMAMPKRVQAALRLFVDVIVLGLAAVMIYYGMVLVASATQPTSTLKVPQYVVYMSVPVSAVLIIIHTVSDMGGTVRELLDGGSRP